MTDHYASQIASLIDTILAQAPKKLPALQKNFLIDYFGKMPLTDLQKLEPKRAFAIAQASFGFYEERAKGEAKIRLYTPKAKTHKWAHDGLVLEILHDDKPFLVDSLTAMLTDMGFSIYETIHPVYHATRTAKGALKKLTLADEVAKLSKKAAADSKAAAESFIHFELSAMPANLTPVKLKSEITRLLGTVDIVVEDWRPLLSKVQEVGKEVAKSKQVPAEEVTEIRDFLRWLVNNNFVFLGYVEYDIGRDKKGEATLAVRDGSGLGLFRSEDYEGKPRGIATLPKDALNFLLKPQLLQITKSTRKSVIHRPVLMDYVAIKEFDKAGNVIGEKRFLGMFTSTVYYQSADKIPYIRHKILQTLKRANFDPMSHNGKQLKAILEFYPRDELFQITLEDLFYFSIGILSVEARPDVRLLVRKDEFERFMSCMVYVPRDRFSTYLRQQIESILESAFRGKVSAFYTQLSDSPLARVHLVVATTPCKIPEFDVAALEKQIAQVTNKWEDSLRAALYETHGEKEGERLLRAYADAFPSAYVSRYEVQDALADIEKSEQAIKAQSLQVDLYKRKVGGGREAARNETHLKVYASGVEMTLSDMLPILEHLGCKVLDANPYTIRPKRRKNPVAMRDFRIDFKDDISADSSDVKTRFEEALLKVCSNQMADDAFNALVLGAGLSWKGVHILRAYSQYIQQTNFPYSRQYVSRVLAKYAKLTHAITELYNARFNPELSEVERSEECKALNAFILDELENVENLAEDRIVRRFYELILATLRTNFFQHDAHGNTKPYVSFKFDSAHVPGLPLPRPYREIFVYSLTTEGIHLRGGPVSRGGLRWSDRPEDFRTEVLGLMKAQMVKNAVIVPQGSKGGFVVKRMPEGLDRGGIQEHGIASYKQFLSGLLDVTDNIVGDDIIPPSNVVRHDADDPYLVVAADKGTATFSDIANGVAEDYGFWLGDAFASGGSVGYDHKAMGITAKGAWVSVQRHFMEVGKDIQTTDFTVAGIGDMGGDVFGNGMLLSKHIRLVAAFNHRHIFIDPNPDSAKSYKERKRLFELPRSSWEDYKKSLISKGGGVFDRTQKVIKLSKEMRDILDVKVKQASPDELIQMILKAPVELLWNGGIGTYVKAETESHDDVGDRANNALRINGSELRCNVVGEGGNLGFTQLGRIEYARNGGRINTDAIDNSAGVDCSDHEVNIKIALGKAVEKKRLTKKKRDVLLASMTDEVGELVLIDNQLQTQALTIAEHQGYALLDPLARMMKQMEEEGFLDRAVEFLPDEKQLADRRATKKGYTRPELSVLLSYAKLALFNDLENSSMLDSTHFEYDLIRYFPHEMQGEYVEEIHSHRLRREIIGTIITNSLINRAGIAFMYNMREETGMHPCDIARAYIVTRDAFGLRDYWQQIQALDGKVDAEIQAEMFIRINHFIEQMTLWFLRNAEEPIDMNLLMGKFADGIKEFTVAVDALMSNTLKKAYDKDRAYFKRHKVPEKLAKMIARLEALCSAPDVVSLAQQHSLDVTLAGAVYFELGARLRFGWLRRSASHLPHEDYWDKLAMRAMVEDLYTQQRRLCTDALALTKKETVEPQAVVNRWMEAHEKSTERYVEFIQDLKNHEAVDQAMVTVALRQIAGL